MIAWYRTNPDGVVDQDARPARSTLRQGSRGRVFIRSGKSETTWPERFGLALKTRGSAASSRSCAMSSASGSTTTTQSAANPWLDWSSGVNAALDALRNSIGSAAGAAEQILGVHDHRLDDLELKIREDVHGRPAAPAP
jgi:hypothetical protein